MELPLAIGQSKVFCQPHVVRRLPLTRKVTIVIRISAIFRLFVAVTICILVCGSESAASESMATTDPTPTVSLPAPMRSLVLANASKSLDDYALPRVVPKTTTILKLALAGLVSLSASIALYLKRIADRNNIRQMLNGSNHRHGEVLDANSRSFRNR